MQGFPTLKCLCAVVLVVVAVSQITSAAPSYADGMTNRELYDLLLKKEILNELAEVHDVERKSERSPSLRLRFGRRSDPAMFPASPYMLAREAVGREDN